MAQDKPISESGPPSLLTVDEVAQLLRVAPKTVYRYLSQGQLPSVRFGGAVRVSREDLMAYLACQQPPGAPMPQHPGTGTTPARARCASCRRLLPQEMLSATCLAPACGGLLCTDCQAQWPSLLCPTHRPSLEQRLALARSQGRPPVLAQDAALWEEDFLARFRAGVETLAQFPHPLGGASSPRKAGRQVEEPLGFQAPTVVPDQGAFPRGLAVAYDFPLRPDGRSRWSLAAGVMLRLDRLAREGFDTDPVDRTLWQEWLVQFAREAAAQQRLWIVGLGSPTGWAQEVCDLVAGGPQQRPVYEQWVAPALIGPTGDGLAVWANPADGRLKPFLHLFLGQLPLEQEQGVREYVQGRRRDGLIGVTAAEVAQACHLEPSTVQGYFHQMERAGQGTTEWVQGFGLVLFHS